MITAQDNVSLLETITSKNGQLVTQPSPAALAYFGEKLKAIKQNQVAHSAFFNNALLPWRQAFDNPREWQSYADKMATRTVDLGATSILLDAHGSPGSVQNNPNDPQNELRFTRYRPNYRQYFLYENRDEFTPITIDGREILRLMQEGGPNSTNTSDFVAAQLTMAVNADRAREFHTLMNAVGYTASRPNLYHLQVPNLRAPGATADQAREVTAIIRTAVLGLADYVPFFTPAGVETTVPKEQVRLTIRQTVMQRIGTLAYANSFNPEHVFALPEDQIVELPDHYFDRQPGLSDKDFYLTDAGTDQANGSIIVKDTAFGWGIDQYGIKNTENRALHHASILGTNDFKTFITGGIGAGTQIITPQIVPTTIDGFLYGPAGDVVNGGDLLRGQEYSSKGDVRDAQGYPAGGWTVTLTSVSNSASRGTYVGLYNEVKIANDELAASVTIEWASILNPEIKVSRTYNLTGAAIAANGSGVLVNGGTVAYDAGTRTITYVNAVGEIAEISADNGATWTTAAASPIVIPSGQTRRFRKTAASGYVYPTGARYRVYGPWTAA